MSQFPLGKTGPSAKALHRSAKRSRRPLAALTKGGLTGQVGRLTRSAIDGATVTQATNALHGILEHAGAGGPVLVITAGEAAMCADLRFYAYGYNPGQYSLEYRTKFVLQRVAAALALFPDGAEIRFVNQAV